VDADAKARLAKVQDPGFRKLLEELYWHVMRNENDPKFWARERIRAAQKRQDELDWAHALTASALRGVFGKPAQDIANKRTGQGERLDDDTCLLVARDVCSLPSAERKRVKE
jgi:hypothetical protein